MAELHVTALGAFVGPRRVASLAREALTINFHLDVTMHPDQARYKREHVKPYIKVAQPTRRGWFHA
jgi:hypothetical protein